jgi:hypothetical protein
LPHDPDYSIFRHEDKSERRRNAGGVLPNARGLFVVKPFLRGRAAAIDNLIARAMPAKHAFEWTFQKIAQKAS